MILGWLAFIPLATSGVLWPILLYIKSYAIWVIRFWWSNALETVPISRHWQKFMELLPTLPLIPQKFIRISKQWKNWINSARCLWLALTSCSTMVCIITSVDGVHWTGFRTTKRKSPMQLRSVMIISGVRKKPVQKWHLLWSDLMLSPFGNRAVLTSAKRNST